MDVERKRPGRCPVLEHHCSYRAAKADSMNAFSGAVANDCEVGSTEETQGSAGASPPRPPGIRLHLEFAEIHDCTLRFPLVARDLDYQ